MPAVNPGTNVQILTRIRDRLRDKVESLTEQNCFVCDAPIPEVLTEGILNCTVSPTNSQFPDEFQTGAGYRQVTEEFGIDVSLLSWVELDEPGREEISLLDAEVGILNAYKRPVLRALLYDDDNDAQWRITDDGGTDILRDHLTVVSTTQPHRKRIGDKPHSWLVLTITFRSLFDWNLVS